VRVFLTGGTGYLGGRVARALRDAGHDVIALTRSRERGASLLGCGASLVEGELGQPGEWTDALVGADALVHTAALVEEWGPPPEEFDRVNVVGTLDLLDRARQAKVERVVVTGSLFALGSSPDGTPRDESALDAEPGPLAEANDYIRTKTAVVRRIRGRQRRGGRTMLVVPTILIGPGALTQGNHTARVIADIARRRFPGLVGNGNQVWNLVPVDAVAHGYLRVLAEGEPGRNYVLGGENWTQARLVARIAELLGVKPPLRRLGRALPLAVAALAEGWASVSGRPPFLTRGAVRLYDANWSFTSERALRELGYEPGSVDDTLRETVAWLRDEVWRLR
jgi:dihydroflavonol-4-reductase